MESATVWQALMRPPWRFLFGRWPWLTLLYLLISALLGAALLVLVVGTLLVVPLWGLALGSFERRRARMLGFPPQASGHVRVNPEQRHSWLSVRLSETATWRETAALFVDLLLGWVALGVLALQALAVTVTVSITIDAFGAETATRPIESIPVSLGPTNWWVVIPIGLVMIVVFAYANALLAAGQASLLRVLAGPRQRELARNTERLLQSRATLVEAFEAERRRIERDLHDGVQQELVTLAARLGMVSLELEDLARGGADTVQADSALEAAQRQAEHTLETLRSTVRGIHPAVLTDHGLRPALNELAHRTAVPLRLELAAFDRVPVTVETAAYYLVTEAVTNATKHADATEIRVRADVENGRFSLTVTDDGCGGADASAGTGLRGLRERIETLGGELSIDSPAGGPTTLRMATPIMTEKEHRHATPTR
ncbi:sensor histidine kinase [Tessaracoccus caeni]|uniref:sensor histidine kinase n=1 Tax=Tessaracoccus caeni TaxID=3031239 RepID=UPI0023DA5F5E|nr:sensor histidine kinase [Tessaracoccus caeni]MDF1488705.1 sensor histidine kinase [Tessaracoccus caeni]